MPWQTGDVIAAVEYIYRRVRIPKDLNIIMAVNGALLELTRVYRWEQFGIATPEETAALLEALYDDFVGSNVDMIGSIFPYATTNPPENCLVCDGTQYNRVDYPALYAALDAAFIVDTDHFVTPDLRGKFIFGSDLTRAVGATGGEETHTLTEAEMPSHSHLYDHPVPNIDVEAPGVPDVTALGTPYIPTNAAYAGGGQPHNNMPPYAALKYCMVAR